MDRRVIHWIGAAATLFIFVAALWVLHRNLETIHVSDVAEQFRSLSRFQVLTACFLTIGSYLLLTVYDVLGLSYVGRPLPYSRTALASFIAYAFSHNIGLALITGGSIRYRIYSEAGLSVSEIAAVSALCAVTFGMGTVLVAAVVMVMETGEMTELLHLPPAVVIGAGVAIFVAAAGYLGWTAMSRSAIRIGDWSFRLPSFRMSVFQFLLAIADITVAGMVMYVLLPQSLGISFTAFLGIYVLAMVAGIVSHVPGGIGVFEAVLVMSFPDLPGDVLLGSALAYRVIYYVVPLGIAAFTLAILEFARRRVRFDALSAEAGAWVERLAPQLVGLAVVIAGAVLLFSGATPSAANRIDAIRQFIPLPLLEVSHMLASTAGFGLLILARGLFRRSDAAFHLTLALLFAGILSSLIKGFDFEEALVLILILAALLLSRDAFSRKASLLSQPFSVGWVVTILVIVTGSFWLGLFSYKHVAFSNELWWQFAFNADAPRSLRASLVVTILALGVAATYLLNPARPASVHPGIRDLERVREIIKLSSSANGNLALVGDKQLMFSEQGNSFIMYAVERRSWIALGDPVGALEEWQGLAWEYRELCDRCGGWPVFYQVDSTAIPLYLDLGLSMLKLGEEGRVSLTDFSLEGSRRAEFRQVKRRAEREGLDFEVVRPAGIQAIVGELAVVSDAWLAEKNTREKRFSVGFFSEAYLSEFPCGVVRRDGRIVAFANLLLSGDSEELSIDLMRFKAGDAPNFAMDYLFTELMLWGRLAGYRWFNLGMAPLSGLEAHRLAPLWHKLGTLIFRHGEHFYNFEGLRRYKEKFDPVWKPKYLASPGGLRVPGVLMNVASLIAGGVTDIWSK